MSKPNTGYKPIIEKLLQVDVSRRTMNQALALGGTGILLGKRISLFSPDRQTTPPPQTPDSAANPRVLSKDDGTLSSADEELLGNLNYAEVYHVMDAQTGILHSLTIGTNYGKMTFPSVNFTQFLQNLQDIGVGALEQDIRLEFRDVSRFETDNLGIKPDVEAPGFKQLPPIPQPDGSSRRITYISSTAAETYGRHTYTTPAGTATNNFEIGVNLFALAMMIYESPAFDNVPVINSGEFYIRNFVTYVSKSLRDRYGDLDSGIDHLVTIRTANIFSS